MTPKSTLPKKNSCITGFLGNKTLSHVFLKTHSPSLAIGHVKHTSRTHISPSDETHTFDRGAKVTSLPFSQVDVGLISDVAPGFRKRWKEKKRKKTKKQ